MVLTLSEYRLETESKRCQDKNIANPPEVGQVNPFPNLQQIPSQTPAESTEPSSVQPMSWEGNSVKNTKPALCSENVPAPEVCATQAADKATEKQNDDQGDNEKKSEDVSFSKPKTPLKTEEIKGEDDCEMKDESKPSDETQMPKPPDLNGKRTQDEESKSKIKRVPVHKWRARSCEEYDFSTLIGKGTFGRVYKAKLKNPVNAQEANEFVALKKLNKEKEEEGFPITALREIQILRKLRHTNVVHLKEIVVNRRKRLAYLIPFSSRLKTKRRRIPSLRIHATWSTRTTW